MPEKRVDPSDGRSYTQEQLTAFYRNTYTPTEIKNYWNVACVREPPSSTRGKKAKAAGAVPPKAAAAKASPAPKGPAPNGPAPKGPAPKPAAKQGGRKASADAAPPGKPAAPGKAAPAASSAAARSSAAAKPVPPGAAAAGAAEGGGAAAASSGGAPRVCCSRGVLKFLFGNPAPPAVADKAPEQGGALLEAGAR